MKQRTKTLTKKTTILKLSKLVLIILVNMCNVAIADKGISQYPEAPTDVTLEPTPVFIGSPSSSMPSRKLIRRSDRDYWYEGSGRGKHKFNLEDFLVYIPSGDGPVEHWRHYSTNYDSRETRTKTVYVTKTQYKTVIKPTFYPVAPTGRYPQALPSAYDNFGKDIASASSSRKVVHECMVYHVVTPPFTNLTSTSEEGLKHGVEGTDLKEKGTQNQEGVPERERTPKLETSKFSPPPQDRTIFIEPSIAYYDETDMTHTSIEYFGPSSLLSSPSKDYVTPVLSTHGTKSLQISILISSYYDIKYYDLDSTNIEYSTSTIFPTKTYTKPSVHIIPTSIPIVPSPSTTTPNQEVHKKDSSTSISTVPDSPVTKTPITESYDPDGFSSSSGTLKPIYTAKTTASHPSFNKSSSLSPITIPYNEESTIEIDEQLRPTTESSVTESYSNAISPKFIFSTSSPREVNKTSTTYAPTEELSTKVSAAQPTEITTPVIIDNSGDSPLPTLQNLSPTPDPITLLDETVSGKLPVLEESSTQLPSTAKHSLEIETSTTDEPSSTLTGSQTTDFSTDVTLIATPQSTTNFALTEMDSTTEVHPSVSEEEATLMTLENDSSTTTYFENESFSSTHLPDTSISVIIETTLQSKEGTPTSESGSGTTATFTESSVTTTETFISTTTPRSNIDLETSTTSKIDRSENTTAVTEETVEENKPCPTIIAIPEDSTNKEITHKTKTITSKPQTTQKIGSSESELGTSDETSTFILFPKSTTPLPPEFPTRIPPSPSNNVTIPLDKNYWVRSVLAETTYEKSKKYYQDILSKAYKIAYQRANVTEQSFNKIDRLKNNSIRRRRDVSRVFKMEGRPTERNTKPNKALRKKREVKPNINVRIQEVNHFRESNVSEIIYTVFDNDNPILATEAVDIMDNMNDSEVESIVGHPMIIKAEEYIQGSTEEEDPSNKKLIAIILGTVMGLILLSFLLFMLVRFYQKKNRRRFESSEELRVDPEAPSPRSTQDEGGSNAGRENEAFDDTHDQESSPELAERGAPYASGPGSPQQPSTPAGEEEVGDGRGQGSKESLYATVDKKRPRSVGSAGKASPGEHIYSIPKTPTFSQRQENINIGIQNSRFRLPENVFRNPFGTPDFIPGTNLPKFLPPPKLHFPLMPSPTMEPRIVSMDEVQWAKMEEGRNEPLPSQVHDPGNLGGSMPILSKSVPDVSVDPGVAPGSEMGVGKLRKRFHDLLDDAFNLMHGQKSSSKVTRLTSGTPYQVQSERALSAMAPCRTSVLGELDEGRKSVLPESKLPYPISRRPWSATAAFHNSSGRISPASGSLDSSPRSAWAEQGGRSITPVNLPLSQKEMRPDSAPLRTGLSRVGIRTPTPIDPETGLRASDPAVPLIKAIKDELRKFKSSVNTDSSDA